MIKLEDFTMKRFITLALVLVLALSLLTACGGKNKTPNAAGGDLIGNLVENAITANAFSEEAAFQALGYRGIKKEAIRPDWDYTVDEALYTTYGDTSHGSIEFIKEDGELTKDEYNIWLKKVFEATAAISDDKHNIEGFSYGDGDIELTFDAFINKDSWMQAWSYKYNGTIMDVTVSLEEDRDQESVLNDDWTWTYHYKSVEIDIANGLQKSWDETWKEMEDYFDEHGDEIEDALKDYMD
jgi:hypothetical protein